VEEVILLKFLIHWFFILKLLILACL